MTDSEAEAFADISRAERLLDAAADDPSQARPAAIAALSALLLEWGLTPRADSVVALLEQAAETDDTLLSFRPEAAVLDRFDDEHPPDAADRARIFVDAARGRLANI
jgi:hypothetical protein